MTRGSKLLLGIAAAVLAVGLASRETRAPASGADRIAAVRGLAAEAGLPDEWGDFFALVAERESKGYARAKNDSPSEAAAAERAYRRNAERYESCGYGEEAYEFSGGWFGAMPANGLAQLDHELRCLPPTAVFEPRVALAMAVGFARALMKWDRFAEVPTWLNLRAMWGWPDKGGDAEYLEERRPKYVENAAAVGLPAWWLDERPPPLNITPSQVLERLNFKESEIAA